MPLLVTHPIQALTGSTHKRLGLEELLEDALPEAFCMISSGNRNADMRAFLEEQKLEIPVYTLANACPLNGVDITIEPGRVLRNAKERAAYTAEHTGIPAAKIRDVTDFTSRALREYLADQIERNGVGPEFVAVPVGSGGLYLAAVDAVRETGVDTKVIGVTPTGKNGIFMDPRTSYFIRDGDLFVRQRDFSSITDKLTCPYTELRERVLNTFSDGHIVLEATEHELRAAFCWGLKWYGAVEPSSFAGLVTAMPHRRAELGMREDDIVMALITGTTDLDGIDEYEKQMILDGMSFSSRQMASAFHEYHTQEGAWDTNLNFTVQEHIHDRYAPQNFTFRVDTDTCLITHEEFGKHYTAFEVLEHHHQMEEQQNS